MKFLFNFLPIILSPASTKRLLINSLGPAFLSSFSNEFANEFIVLDGGNYYNIQDK